MTRKVLSELDTSDSEPSSPKRTSDTDHGPDSGVDSMKDFKVRVDEVLKESGWVKGEVEEDENMDMFLLPRTPLREYGTAPFLLHWDSCSDDDDYDEDEEEKHFTESEGRSEHDLCESESRSENEERGEDSAFDMNESNADYGNGGYDAQQNYSNSYQEKEEVQENRKEQ